MDHILKPKGSRGTADAFYCRECVVQESDRDGCPRVVNLGVARMDLFYHRKEREKGAE
jgi:PHD finger-like domain-containing protein 5A